MASEAIDDSPALGQGIVYAIEVAERIQAANDPFYRLPSEAVAGTL